MGMDAGAGHSGGLGYEGAGLNLATYEGIRRGSRRPDGTKLDVLARRADGVAPITRHLMARHAEVRGHVDEKVLGMPLGLPPIELEAIAVLRGWIAQGAPK